MKKLNDKEWKFLKNSLWGFGISAFTAGIVIWYQSGWKDFSVAVVGAVLFLVSAWTKD